MGRIIQHLTFYPLIAISVVTIITIGKVNGDESMTVYGAPRGENITLPCPLSLTSELLALYWDKDGNRIFYHRSGYVPSTSKYRLTGKTSLTITNIDRSDAGSYTCRATLNDGSLPEIAGIQLFVMELLVSHCPDTLGSREDVAECDCLIDGKNTSNLTCTALGFPRKPDITWDLGHKLRYESSVIDLTAYSKNRTLVCLAEDSALGLSLKSKRVCVTYQLQIYACDPCQDNEPNKQSGWFIPFFCVMAFVLVFTLSVTSWIVRMKMQRRQARKVIQKEEDEDLYKVVHKMIEMKESRPTTVIRYKFLSESSCHGNGESIFRSFVESGLHPPDGERACWPKKSVCVCIINICSELELHPTKELLVHENEGSGGGHALEQVIEYLSAKISSIAGNIKIFGSGLSYSQHMRCAEERLKLENKLTDLGRNVETEYVFSSLNNDIRRPSCVRSSGINQEYCESGVNHHLVAQETSTKTLQLLKHLRPDIRTFEMQDWKELIELLILLDKMRNKESGYSTGRQAYALETRTDIEDKKMKRPDLRIRQESLESPVSSSDEEI